MPAPLILVSPSKISKSSFDAAPLIANSKSKSRAVSIGTTVLLSLVIVTSN
ncbi:MAG: hypothetical protein LBC74_11285 [Planctomycetaceae bacterium]|nr:hypothetical protein [Planctomycetaceae bacterium]